MSLSVRQIEQQQQRAERLELELQAKQAAVWGCVWAELGRRFWRQSYVRGSAHCTSSKPTLKKPTSAPSSEERSSKRDSKQRSSSSYKRWGLGCIGPNGAGGGTGAEGDGGCIGDHEVSSTLWGVPTGDAGT